MTTANEVHLDNMAWHALNGPQSHLGESSANGAAVRYLPQISPLMAVDRIDQDAWDGLSQLVGPRGYAAFFRSEVAVAAPGWKPVFAEQVTQYVADELTPMPDEPFLDLTCDEATAESNAADMHALATLTEPGPFEAETYRTSFYIGIRSEGRLIAMAGERMRSPGWGEVSAVCVHPEHRGLGYGGALTLAAAHRIRARGDEAMLHVLDSNDPAHALYQKLGFRTRRVVHVGVFRNLT